MTEPSIKILLRMLLEDGDQLDELIRRGEEHVLRTPTGDLRNFLTDALIVLRAMRLQ